MRRAFCIAMIPFAASAGAAQCRMQNSDPRPHLVELYTSEGCNSCPPAERWMSTLLKHDDLIGLEFHVDYWDTGDWHDPFADHAYTARQQAIAHRRNHDQSYTPQIWVDGRLWYNWPKGTPPDPANAVPPALTLAIEAGDPLRVAIDGDAAAGKPDYRMYAALAQDSLTEHVSGGENRGKTLAHDEVVRAFVGPFMPPHADVELRVPPDADHAHTSVVAFIQDEASGDIVQAVRLPLRECAK